ncbi:MAG: hypothetical protein CEO12_598 [Parcubacteria group bacterium Gr01-1014_46]|nr:MAG: hypothetical protein CEO12_598 [Parcubacteria group bacterium Gr01-1014_46]
MQTFVKSFVIVILILGIGCAQNKDGEGLSYCATTPLSPSCDVATPPQSGGQHLTVPTDFVRMENKTDPSVQFPAQVQITSLTPAPGSSVTAPFRFAWNVKLRVDSLPNQNEGVSIELYPSNDGVEANGASFDNGFVKSGGEGSYPGGSPGMITMMPVTFKYILVQAKWGRSGVGYQYSTLSFQVDYGNQ